MSAPAVEASRQEGVEKASLQIAHKSLWPAWLALLAIGSIGVYQRFTLGHLPAGYGSYVPWGLWVALYFHGVGIAGGAFLLGAGGYVLDLPGFRSKRALRATIILSAAAIMPAFMGIWFDLGRMERSHFIFTSPSFSSMMTFNAWMYGAFMALTGLAWALSYRRYSVWLKPVLSASIMFSILFPSQSGVFFAVVDAKPFWHSALLPILFLTSAVTAGAATLLVVRWLLAPMRDVAGGDAQVEHHRALKLLRNVTLAGLIAYLSLEFAKFSIAMWSPSVHDPAIDMILWGQYRWVFWGVHAGLSIVALAMLLSSRRLLWIAGGLTVAVSFVSARLLVLLPGQASTQLAGLEEAFHHERLAFSYHATLMEYLVGVFLVAVGVAVFHAGSRISDDIARRTGSA